MLTRKSAVLHRDWDPPRVATLADSATIFGGAGGMIDLSSGAGVTCLGHSADPVKDAMIHQIEDLPYVHSGNWTTNVCEGLASRLLEIVGDPEGGVFFLSSGAEAVEAACKLAVQWNRELGFMGSPCFFARENSYHGNTMFTLALGDHPRKQRYALALPADHVLRFPMFTPSWSEELRHGMHGLVHLKDALQWCTGRRQPAIVVVEPIAGMTLGIEPATAEYLVELRKLCDEFGAVLIYDEVLSGNYRTGHLFSWQYYQKQVAENLRPDIMVLGKGLTAGYFPLSAVIVSAEIMKAIGSGSRKLWHSTTNQNHPIGCAAGLAALRMYEESAEAIQHLSASLQGLSAQQLFGVGALRGIRLKSNEPGLHMRVREQALQEGVAVYSDGVMIAGKPQNILMLAPPYCITLPELIHGMDVLFSVIKRNAGSMEYA